MGMCVLGTGKAHLSLQGSAVSVDSRPDGMWLRPALPLTSRMTSGKSPCLRVLIYKIQTIETMPSRAVTRIK